MNLMEWILNYKTLNTISELNNLGTTLSLKLMILLMMQSE